MLSMFVRFAKMAKPKMIFILPHKQFMTITHVHVHI